MIGMDVLHAMHASFEDLIRTPLFGITLTVAAYLVAVRIWRAFGRSALLTPVLTAIVLVACFLEITGIDYKTYLVGGSYLSFLLGPATVALAAPLYKAGSAIKQLLAPVAAGVVVGSLTAIASAVLVVRVMGGDYALEATLAPKSATTPIAMALSDGSGGVTALAAVLTVLTGVLGAVAGPWLLNALHVSDPRVRGLALGVSSHGIGTSQALAEGPLTGAFAALAMACSGVTTAILMPVVLTVLG